MKRIIACLTIAAFLSVLPVSAARAEGNDDKQKKHQYLEQIKEKKQLMKQKYANIEDLELQINTKGKDLGNALQQMYNRETVPNDEMIKRIQNKENSLIKILKQLERLSKQARKKKFQANDNARNGNYTLALADYDKMISILDDEEALLKSYYNNLLELIDLINQCTMKK